MLGELPRTLTVAGKSYEIRTDFRDVLRVISAFNADDLTDEEKVYVCLKQIFRDANSIPKQDVQEAYTAAIKFIEVQSSKDDPGPRLINWEKDEQYIFPAVNKTAGFEVRAVPYMHWWTFYGYFQCVDTESVWGFVLSIRQKRAKHKKLEKHEQDFYNANRDLCEIDGIKTTKDVREQSYNALEAFYHDLMAEQEAQQ